MPSNNNSYLGLLITGIMFLLSGTLLMAQPSISYNFENQKLSAAFSQLEKEYQLTFAYDDNLIDQLIITKAQIRNARLDKALRNMLVPLNLGFEILNDEFILIKQLNLSDEFSALEKEKKHIPSVCGTIADSNSLQELIYANIWLKGTPRGVNSNEEGFFRLSGPFSESDTLQISYLGYTTRNVAVKELLNRKCGNLLLSIQKIEIDQVLIKERAIALLRSENNGNGIQFDADKMGTLPGWGDNDVLRMAQLIPGVHSTDESASELHIRGGTPDQNLILWEGIPVYHPGHLFGMFSTINPSVVDEVKIYRGGFGARYGERVSGVIDITGHTEFPDTAEYGAGINLINAHAYLKAPLQQGRSSLMLAFRRSYTDLIQSDTYKKLFDQISGNGKIEDHQRVAEEQQIDLRTNSVFHFSDLHLKWSVVPKANSFASLSFYTGRDELDYDVNLDLSQFNVYFDSNDDISQGNWGLSGFWRESWNEDWESTMRMTYTRFNHLYKIRYTGNKNLDFQARYSQLNKMSDFSFHLDNRWKLASKQSLGFGYQFTGKSVEYELSHEEVNREPASGSELFKGEITTLYTDYDFVEPGRIALDFGMRYNYVGDVDKAYWEPRITVDANLTKSLHFKAAAGKYLQFVSQMIQYNDLGLGEEIWIMANKKYGIPPLSSSQFSFGLWIDKKDFLFDLEFYNKRIKGLTSINLRFNDREENPFSGGDADIQGLDILLKKKWNNYSAWLSYSLGTVEYAFETINQFQPFPATHDQLHTINWTHILSLKNWEFSLSWNFGSGRPYTNALSIVEENDGENTDYSIVYDNRNSKRLPAYHRLDISGHYHWKGLDGINGKVGLSVFNLYDHRNIFDKQFFILSPEEPLPNESPELLLIDRQMLGFTPNIFLELNW